MNEYTAHGFQITIEHKPKCTFTGATRFVRLNGKDIFVFLDELKANEILTAMEDSHGQVWVCLSGNEGRSDADCRCTVCVEADVASVSDILHDVEHHTLEAVESDWAIFTVSPEQDPDELHRIGVYNMIEEIGYRFHGEVGFHLDNEHEWNRGHGMKFMMPVVKAE